MTWKSFTLNDLEGQYCNRNCIGCIVSSRAKRLYCEKYLQNLRMIFSLFIYSLATYKSPGEMTTCDVCYTTVHCSFRDVNIACMKLSHLWQIAFSPWLEIRTMGFGRRRYGRLFLVIAGLIVIQCQHSNMHIQSAVKTYLDSWDFTWFLLLCKIHLTWHSRRK